MRVGTAFIYAQLVAITPFYDDHTKPRCFLHLLNGKDIPCNLSAADADAILSEGFAPSKPILIDEKRTA